MFGVLEGSDFGVQGLRFWGYLGEEGKFENFGCTDTVPEQYSVKYLRLRHCTSQALLAVTAFSRRIGFNPEL